MIANDSIVIVCDSNIKSNYEWIQISPTKIRRNEHPAHLPTVRTQKEFTLYVDERNVPIDESCGRCNRERCGYHLTPSEYFKAHPTYDRTDFAGWKQPEAPKVIPVSYLPSSLLITDTHRASNNLFRFMAKEFGNDEANRVFNAYHVGTSRHWKIATG